MKKNRIYLSLLFLVCFSGYAQLPYKGNVRVMFDESSQTRQTVILKADIDLTNLYPRTNQAVTFTPALRSLDGSRQIDFEPFTLYSKRKAKIIKRQAYFAGEKSLPSSNAGIIPFTISLPFETWMLHSQMIVVEHTAGCGNDSLIYSDGNRFKIYESKPYLFPEPYTPRFIVSYRTAPAEEVKIMEETYSAQLSFRVNQTDLLRQFGNNERVLYKADEIINRLKNDSLLTIRTILVRGYASPEGNAAHNQRLSEGRARAFVTYLHDRHNFYQMDRMIIAEGRGEDWAGLRKAVEERPYLENRERILDIIDSTYDPERRKSLLKSLAGGQTYKRLLEELYPPLRRNEYTIEYEVRGFTAEEARTIFKTRPQLLSLEEMFMVANLYEHDSEDYKQVFDVAARLYPDSEVAQFNAGAMEIENGSYNTAIKRLETLETPDAFNNLGIAWWHKGEYHKAEQYLRKAAESGNQQAIQNLTEFARWQEDEKKE